jgi:hypothetical protein
MTENIPRPAIDPEARYDVSGADLVTIDQILNDRRQTARDALAIIRGQQETIVGLEAHILHQTLLILQHQQDDAVRAAMWLPYGTARQWVHCWSVWIGSMFVWQVIV